MRKPDTPAVRGSLDHRVHLVHPVHPVHLAHRKEPA